LKLRLALVLSVVSLGVAAVSVEGAPPNDKVKLVRRTKKGDRLTQKERQRTETTGHWKSEGEGTANSEEVEEIEREFAQEVLKEDPLLLKREYRTSLRTKGKAKDDKVQPVRTSVHGKVVLVTPDGAKIEGGIISPEDRDSLDRVERIAYALLPKDEVGTGDSWKVSDEVGRAVFRGMFDPENCQTRGLAKLDGWKVVDGHRGAKLSLKVAIDLQPGELVPAIQAELKGTAVFLVDEGVFSDLTLEGPIHIAKTVGKRSWSSDGQTVFTLKAQVVAAAPVEAVAKDDEIAKAKQLECPKGHKFPNEFLFCGSCGKALNAETKRCPGGCAPLLRHCVVCGEALAPAK
jgi:hypothetical protein